MFTIDPIIMQLPNMPNDTAIPSQNGQAIDVTNLPQQMNLSKVPFVNVSNNLYNAGNLPQHLNLNKSTIDWGRVADLFKDPRATPTFYKVALELLSAKLQQERPQVNPHLPDIYKHLLQQSSTYAEQAFNPEVPTPIRNLAAMQYQQILKQMDQVGELVGIPPRQPQTVVNNDIVKPPVNNRQVPVQNDFNELAGLYRYYLPSKNSTAFMAIPPA